MRRKYVAWLLVMSMVAGTGTTGIQAMAAGETESTAETEIAAEEVTDTSESDGSYERPYEVNVQEVKADGEQAALETHTKTIIEQDGLKFKDLNGNGTLDVYEDWRQDTDARVEDLLSQMTLEEKVGSLFHASTGGTFTSLYPYTEEFLYSNESQKPLHTALPSDHFRL